MVIWVSFLRITIKHSKNVVFWPPFRNGSSDQFKYFFQNSFEHIRSIALYSKQNLVFIQTSRSLDKNVNLIKTKWWL